jgi:hypothetical protein
MPKVHEMMKEPANWGKGRLNIDNGPDAPECHCAYGWIMRCYPLLAKDEQGRSLQVLAIDKLRDYLADAVGDPAIARWNDREFRTFEQVKEVFVKLDI